MDCLSERERFYSEFEQTIQPLNDLGGAKANRQCSTEALVVLVIQLMWVRRFVHAQPYWPG